MAYEAKPGQFSLFPNDRKANPSQPDYKGDGKDLDGNDVWVSAWLKDGTKGAFMSCSMQRKEAQAGASKPAAAAAPKPTPRPAATSKPAPNFNDMDDDLPF